MPVPLDVTRLREALGARWARIDVVGETASTNADLLAAADAPDRTALAAEFQHAGRGRFDRTWSSPRGAGLLFSALLRPAVPLPLWGWLPLLAGLAVAETVQQETGVATALKWPNDLLAGPGRRKAAGILVQSAGGAAVVGVGLNVSLTADELPRADATSLTLEGAADVDRTAVLIALLTRIDTRAAQWADVGGDAAACGLRAAYRERCATLGADVRVHAVDGTALDARAVDVDETGRLLVETADGPRHVGAGDVEHLR